MARVIVCVDLADSHDSSIADDGHEERHRDSVRDDVSVVKLHSLTNQLLASVHLTDVPSEGQNDKEVVESDAGRHVGEHILVREVTADEVEDECLCYAHDADGDEKSGDNALTEFGFLLLIFHHNFG